MANALGIFGGTFDPVHYGHLRAADEVLDALGLAEVRMVPARDPPHRGAPGATAAQRVDMLRLALCEFPRLSLDTREMARTGKSYTFDTLAALRAEMPARAIVFITGVDAFAGLPTWHRWQEIPTLAHIAVVTRPEVRVEDVLHGSLAQVWNSRYSSDRRKLESATAGTIFAVSVTPQPISATALRAALAGGTGGAAQLRGLLPAAVLTYIDQHQLYRPPPDAP